MIKWRLSRLLSIAVAPIAGLIAAPIAVSVSSTPAVAQEETQAATSCFVGVDYSTLTLAELQSLIETSVSQLDPGMSDEDIALEIGRQIGESAGDCSAEQVAALIQNVAQILTELGIQPEGNVKVADLVGVGVSPSTATTEAAEFIPTIRQPYL